MTRIITILLLFTLAACSPTRAAIQQPANPTPTPQPTAAPAVATATDAPHVCTVTAESLHIRSGAGLSFGVIGYLYAGDIVTIQTRRGAWLEVTTNSGAGFIHSHYCEE